MDTFYNTRELSFSQKIDLLRDCKEICYTWWVDKLDCSESMSRQQIDMDFEEVISKFDDSAHFVVVDREFIPFEKVKHFEIAFKTMGGIEYFLWIWVEDKRMTEILEKYGLYPR
ncbi:MAG: hypothetical protein ACK5L7_11175 [Paludibacteraceae bacterium]